VTFTTLLPHGPVTLIDDEWFLLLTLMGTIALVPVNVFDCGDTLS